MRGLLSVVVVAGLVGCPTPTPTNVVDTTVAPVEAVGFPERPTPGEPAVFTPPAPQHLELSNGIQVYVLPDDSLPLVSLRMLLPTGSANDAGKAGLASLGGSMLGESAGDRSSLDQAAALNALAASAGVRVGRENLVLSLDCHAEKLADALPSLPTRGFGPV